MERVYSHTLALCPQCQAKVRARILERNAQIYLRKYCPVHGESEALICSDAEWYQASMQYVKPGQHPLVRAVKEFHGCPKSCGLCPEHQQHTCLPVIEITSRCNLNCPVCLKNYPQDFEMSAEEYAFILNRLKEYEEAVPVINLSGGEPTIHPEIERFLRMSVDNGIMQTTVSTNGLRLLEDAHLRNVFRETETIVALQFDGFQPDSYRYLRGADLTEKKQRLIHILEQEHITYSLVATIARHVNDREISSLVDCFFESQAVSLMFQPASFTGSAAGLPAEELRMTIPDIVHESAKSRYVSKDDFNPLPCSHFSCFALAYYLVIEQGDFLSLKEFLGKEQYLEVIANRTLPGLDSSGYGIIKEKIYGFWSAADPSCSNEQILKRARHVLQEMNHPDFTPKKAFSLGMESMKAIFIHQFMDMHTFDFGRLIKCCNHYPQIDGRLIPMCVMNTLGKN